MPKFLGHSIMLSVINRGVRASIHGVPYHSLLSNQTQFIPLLLQTLELHVLRYYLLAANVRIEYASLQRPCSHWSNSIFVKCVSNH